jgi:phosphatidylethanolamine/phosphatidyl-N-methylethanolamine N-methyltransferase
MPFYDPRAFFTFVKHGVTKWDQTASPIPSQRFLVNRMVAAVHPESAGAIVELGPGVGVMTKPLLDRMRKDAKLYTIEIEEQFQEALCRNVSDPRLVPILGSAADIESMLAERGFTGKVDAVMSGLGMSLIPGAIREQILESARRVLAPHGVFVQFGYFHTKYLTYHKERGLSGFDYEGMLKKHFKYVSRAPVPLNVPPAWVYTARP